MAPEPQDTESSAVRRAGRHLVWVGFGALLLIGALVWAEPTGGSVRQRDVTGDSGHVESIPEPSGTSGGEMIHELETITGTLDGHELVGQRVDLHVDVASIPAFVNEGVRFWIGPRDNPVLVVLNRDALDAPLQAGRRYAISGSVRRLPAADKMLSWDLTDDDRQMVAQRSIYVAATTAVPQ